MAKRKVNFNVDCCPVEAWAGNKNGEDHTISDNKDVYHCVKVENLKTYEADIGVFGEIKASQNRARFESPNVNDTDKEWTDRFEGLLYTKARTFDHVKIKPVSGKSGGDEDIYTEVTIEWSQISFQARDKNSFEVEVI